MNNNLKPILSHVHIDKVNEFYHEIKRNRGDWFYIEILQSLVPIFLWYRFILCYLSGKNIHVLYQCRSNLSFLWISFECDLLLKTTKLIWSNSSLVAPSQQPDIIQTKREWSLLFKVVDLEVKILPVFPLISYWKKNHVIRRFDNNYLNCLQICLSFFLGTINIPYFCVYCPLMK